MSARTLIAASVSVIAMAAILLGTEAYVRRADARAPRSDMPLLYYRHDRMQRAFVRGAHYEGRVHININRFGFRGAEIEAKKPAGVTRIIAMGASVTFDPCVNTDSASWPARLEHWLGVLAPNSKFEVINAGVPGYSMLDINIRLEDEIYGFAPDVILLYAGHGAVGHDDVARSQAAVSSGTPDSPTPHEVRRTMPWDNWLGRHSLLYHKVMARMTRRGRIDQTPLTHAQWESGIERAASDFRHELTNFALIAKNEGARVVLGEMARVSGDRKANELDTSEREIWQRGYQAPPELTLQAIRQSGAVQRAVSDSLGLTFVASNGFGITGQQNYCSGDAIHFSDSGSDMMGQKMAEALLSTGVLKLATR